MLLVIDVGNTNMKLGVYDGDVLKKSWRLSTEAKRTADELGMILYDLFKNVGVEFQDIDGIIMSSVAPMLNYTVEHMCTYYMKKKPVFVDATLKTGLKIKYNNPSNSARTGSSTRSGRTLYTAGRLSLWISAARRRSTR